MSISVAVLAAVGLLVLAIQESRSGPGWQIPAVIGLLLLVLSLFVVVKKRRNKQ
ncbi:LPXTG cell wall anchor domain-containing protein [Streptomyces sp. BV286]|uniref:LPXTG cell wall anchor domain-containing protein n=1 Tax=Streptomyces sp. BV286 TaxID=2849672 RepID=UPI001C2E328D|nr:LPXTG cell wall anchor domain-containing protein [Streptomyces sp. BV286]